jgi:hypothetical protein
VEQHSISYSYFIIKPFFGICGSRESRYWDAGTVWWLVYRMHLAAALAHIFVFNLQKAKVRGLCAHLYIDNAFNFLQCNLA